jgi:predicted alpha/beta hydrolase family esterase
MNKSQIAFIHGGEVFADRKDALEYLRSGRELRNLLWTPEPKPHWREDIARRFFDRAEIFIPEMPNKMDSRYTEWEAWFDRYVPLFRDGVILIGSSLGGIFLAKYLSTRTLPVKVRLLVLIATPFDDESEYTLGGFRLPGNLDGIARQAGQVLLCYSKDDPVVPFSELEKYSHALSGAEAIVVEDRGHFAIATFPELVERLETVISEG